MVFDMVEDTKHHYSTIHVPSKFSRLLCMCKEPGPPLFDGTKRPSHVNTCKTCLKPYRWNLRHCTVCKDWFIKDFRSDISDCVTHTKCWKCLTTTEVCCGQAYTAKARSRFGPLGLNPREVPQEEIDAAFDMPSVFD